MDYYGMSHVYKVAERIAMMSYQPLPRRGQIRHENDDYLIAAVLIKELKMAIQEVKNLGF